MFAEGQMILEKYLVQSEIARDEIGPVFRAVDVEQGSVWRLSRLTVAAEDIAGLRAEMERIGALQSGYIARPDRLETTQQGDVFLASEWVEGRTLEDVIRNDAPLRLSRACSFARQIAQALETAHHAGIVHGDLKPSNIFVTRSESEVEGGDREHILVSNFGSHLVRKDRCMTLARLTTNGADQPLSGAPEYISPEQAVGTSPEALDGRTDLYPLGVILYEMLTGESPYPKSGPMETLLAHIFDEPHPLPEETPAVISTLVRRMLAAKRADRPASATALIDQLAAWEEPAPSISIGLAKLEPAPAIEPVVPYQTPEVTPPPAPQPVSVSEASQPVFQAVEKEQSSPPDEAGRPISTQDDFAPELAASPAAKVNLEPNPQVSPELELPGVDLAAPAAAEFDADLGATEAPDLNAPAPPPNPSVAVLRPAAAAGARPELFASYHPRPRRRRWLRAVGIAAIVILIVIGSGCGWLYYTGRSYWFDPEYFMMRVSTFFGGSSADNTPQVETDAYSASQPAPAESAPVTPTASSPTSPPEQQTPAGSSSATGAASAAFANLGRQEATKRAPPSHASLAPPALPLAAAKTVAPNAARPAESGPSTLPKQTAAAQKHVTQSPAALVAAAITRGDYYFNLGDYDAAIRAYQEGIAESPLNPKLEAEIARARKAKAAEAKYLQ